MRFVRETSPDVFTELGLDTVIVIAENGVPVVKHPPQVWQSWPPEDQEAVGIFEVVPFAPPPGKQTIGEPRIERIDGVVSEVYDTVDLPPVATPPKTVAAAFNIKIVDGWIPTIDGMFNIGAAIYLDVGLYMLFFVEAQPDTNYFALITGDAPVKRVGEATVEYFTIEVKDGPDGSGFDPASLSVQVMRIEP
ncbi:hypothetical protein [Bradyrhizobium valentinum]|uniref:Uncharacterized protein n=1 Tax=Bradyrhizobium valentinum TaxID=1518501 RepID=A0A0R3L0N9_9BRAD|nr:hypothetical protein [Bradyrhizobium valentinum]KRQ99284.1 hypothetical protein CP49_11855 [Bradyrhizobium valentinum]